MFISRALTQFAERHHFSRKEAEDIGTLASWCQNANEHMCNGDPHADSTNRQDKNENARCWEKDLSRNTGLLEAIVNPKGLFVEYTGLRPCLHDSNGEYFDIPA